MIKINISLDLFSIWCKYVIQLRWRWQTFYTCFKLGYTGDHLWQNKLPKIMQDILWMKRTFYISYLWSVRMDFIASVWNFFVLSILIFQRIFKKNFYYRLSIYFYVLDWGILNNSITRNYSILYSHHSITLLIRGYFGFDLNNSSNQALNSTTPLRNDTQR